jgi:hypothetical protein
MSSAFMVLGGISLFVGWHSMFQARANELPAAGGHCKIFNGNDVP